METYSKRDLVLSTIFTIVVTVIAVASVITITNTIATLPLIQQLADIAVIILDVVLVLGSGILNLRVFFKQRRPRRR